MIIDARLRPAYGGFLQQFADPAANRAFSAKLGMVSPPSVQERSPELMLEEMDRAGITIGVAPGRNGHFRYNVPNEDIVDMVGHYRGRFVGLVGINGADKATALADIDRFVIHGPLKGISLEPGAMPVPWYGNDRRLYPIYEVCEEHHIPVVIMLGGRAGPDVSYSNPAIVTQIAVDFPGVNFMVSHGGWPWVTQILGACFWQPNIWLCPDLYLMNAPGAADYVAAANTFMQDRFLFGSAYPLMPMEASLAKFQSLFHPDVLPKLLYRNAATLFGIAISDSTGKGAPS